MNCSLNKKTLKSKTDQISKTEPKEVEQELADKIGEDLYNIVKEEGKLVESDGGGF